MTQKMGLVRSAVGLLALLLVATGWSAFSGDARVHAEDLAQPGVSVPLQATPLPSTAATEPARVAPPLSLTLTLLCTCGAVGLVLGVLILGLVMRRQPEHGTDKTQP